MLLIDVLVRYGAVALMLFLAAINLRDGAGRMSTRISAVICVSVAALMIGSAPAVLKPPEPLLSALKIIDVLSIPLVWWLGLSLFRDDFRLGVVEWSGLLLYCACNLIYRFFEFGMISRPPFAFDVAFDLYTFFLLGHLVFVVLSGRENDLVERRRSARLYFILALAIGVMITVMAENLFNRSHREVVSFSRAVVALVLSGWALFWLTRFHPEALEFKRLAPVAPENPRLDPKDADLHARLIEEIETHRAFAEQRLAIASLAERLGAPEHRLRALINKGLGHRNFSAFLNAYRIEAAKKALADPAAARTPILTIAMDVGFGSLAPFNRAFKEAEGETPTAYRERMLQSSAP
ncbi:MAG: AraC family transcriptional regulator [Pseudomonadota bacterium]